MTAKLTDNPATEAERIAIFAGTFNPFTVGHKDIVDRGLELFDRIILAVGINTSKATDNGPSAQERVEFLAEVYAGEPRVTPVAWAGLTADLARVTGARFLLRGVRSVADFEYERNMADINRSIAGLETVLLTARPEYSAISSSMVRELEHFGADVTPYKIMTKR